MNFQPSYNRKASITCTHSCYNHTYCPFFEGKAVKDLRRSRNASLTRCPPCVSTLALRVKFARLYEAVVVEMESVVDEIRID